MSVQRCVLIAPLGVTPQILTETLWSLYVQAEPPYLPEKVVVLTTLVGEAFVRAKLLGERVQHPLQGGFIDAEPRWERFCEEVLDGYMPELELVVVRDEAGEPLLDIRNVHDDTCFANACYQKVYELTRTEQPLPLLGSMAGGRKTMSAHLMTAFSVYARPEDRLFHVLVWPSEYEQSNFFYPTGTEDQRVHIDRVEVRFPRLYHVLRTHPDLRDQSLSDLHSILNLLDPFGVVDRTPTHICVYVGGKDSGGQYLEFYDGEEQLARIHISPATLATLLILAEYIARDGMAITRVFEAGTPSDGPLLTEAVCKQREAIVRMCAADENRLTCWMEPDDVSKAISKLRKRLKEHPLAERVIAIRRITYEGTHQGYIWSYTPFPEIRVVITSNRRWWPFSHLRVVDTC